MLEERADMELPKTRLVFLKGELIKKGFKGEIISRHRISNMQDIRFTSTIDTFTSILFVIALVAGGVAKVYINSPNWSWIIAIICGLLAVFSLLAIKKYQLTIETDQGVVVYDLLDTPDEGMGFVLSMKDILRDDKDS